MTLPTFIVIGAMKAGTTSLHQYLRAHPDVFMPDTKELDFFVAEKEWERGIGWYEEQFAGSGGAPVVGEASTNYTKHPLFRGVPARIAAALPDVRLVYVIRHPIQRMRSQYLHAISAGWEHLPLEQALLTNPEYLDNSSYGLQLDQYVAHVPFEQILIVRSEHLRTRRAETVDRVLEHIGARVGAPVRLDQELHATSDKVVPRTEPALVARLPGRSLVRRVVPAAVRNIYGRMTSLDNPRRLTLSADAERRLVERLRPDIRRLRTFMGDDFDGWGLT
jgi:hypothetical protein